MSCELSRHAGLFETGHHSGTFRVRPGAGLNQIDRHAGLILNPLSVPTNSSKPACRCTNQRFYKEVKFTTGMPAKARKNGKYF